MSGLMMLGVMVVVMMAVAARCAVLRRAQGIAEQAYMFAMQRTTAMCTTAPLQLRL
jgi:hypothetical protein